MMRFPQFLRQRNSVIGLIVGIACVLLVVMISQTGPSMSREEAWDILARRGMIDSRDSDWRWRNLLYKVNGPHPPGLESLPHPVWDRAVVPDRMFSLDLSNSPTITDREVEAIAQFPELEHLYLEDTNLTDTQLRQLSHLTSLTLLRLGRTQITDASIPVLANFRELESLSLSGTAITNEACATLARLTKLKGLGLDETPITDAGARQLVTLTNLYDLHFGSYRKAGPLISLETIFYLKKHIGCRISGEFY